MHYLSHFISLILQEWQAVLTPIRQLLEQFEFRFPCLIDQFLSQCQSTAEIENRTPKYLKHMMNGWMTCDFTPFSIVFQLYLDVGCQGSEGCVQWNFYYCLEEFRLKRGSNPGPLDL